MTPDFRRLITAPRAATDGKNDTERKHRGGDGESSVLGFILHLICVGVYFRSVYCTLVFVG